MLGSANGAVIAAPTIHGITIQGMNVQGIVIRDGATDSTILIGANLGADGQLGGTGSNADTFGVGTIRTWWSMAGPLPIYKVRH